MNRSILNLAENAIRRRVSRYERPLEKRLELLREWYCRRSGGHDWSTWQPCNRDFIGSWCPYMEGRWCVRCCKSEQREMK